MIGPGGDHTGGVVDERDRVVVAAVAVTDRAGRGQGLGVADVCGVEGLGECPGVAAGEATGVDGRDRRRSGGRVVGLGVGVAVTVIARAVMVKSAETKVIV